MFIFFFTEYVEGLRRNLTFLKPGPGAPTSFKVSPDIETVFCKGEANKEFLAGKGSQFSQFRFCIY